MVDGSLSQEEIDLLLQGVDSDSTSGSGAGDSNMGAATGGFGADMSPVEQATISDILNQGLSSATDGIGMMISKRVSLGEPYPETVSLEQLQSELGNRQVAFTQVLAGALSGSQTIFIPMPDTIRIAAIPMGNEDAVDTDAELDSAQTATVKELIGPMGFSMASQVSARIGAAVNPMPVDVTVCNGTNSFPLTTPGNYLKVQIPFKIEGSIDSRIIVVIPVAMASEIHQKIQASASASANAGAAQATIPEQPSGPQPGQTGVQDVGFPSLSAHGSGPLQPNMNLLMDVQMTMTVELGRTKMYIKDILGLGEGSIIELDKLAGEPVDLLVNSKLIAKGEVVVIDENFGVRVTDIVKPIERLTAGASTE